MVEHDETAHGWRSMGFGVQLSNVREKVPTHIQKVTYPVKCWTTCIPTGSSSCWLMVRPPYLYKGI
jgi:hypothetical protein